MKKILFVSFIAFLLLSAPIAWSAVQGTIRGTVRDQDGNPIPDVRITLISMSYSAVSINIKSNKNGEFIQIGLQPDYYQIRAEKDGYFPVVFERRVRIQDTVDASFVMEEGTYSIEAPPGEADWAEGNKWFAAGKYEEAVKSYQAAIDKEPEEPIYYNNLGISLTQLNRVEDAIAAYQKMLELQPDSYSANKSLGELYGEKQEFRQALPFFTKAVELSDEDPDAFFNLGACQRNIGMTSEAVGSFVKVIELDANYAPAYYQLGMLYVNLNNKEEAVKALEKFIELAPNDPNAAIAKNVVDYLKKDLY
jgi:tetratricopeptide (TPR) repeat protein